MDIAKSVILITGAGSPTGQALAEHFSALGANIALVDTNSLQLKRSHRACLKKNPYCCAFLLKSQDSSDINKLFSDIKNKLGNIDVLINYWQTAYIPELLNNNIRIDNAAADIASCLYLFGKCAAISMCDKRHGVIINIPSMPTDYPAEHSLACSNTVIRGLTLSWAKELEHMNVRVGGVLPGIRRNKQGECIAQSAINYDMIDGVAYIVENDSFTGRILEAAS